MSSFPGGSRMRWLGRIPAQSVAMQLERYSRKSLAVAIVHSPSSREHFPPSSYIFSQKVTRASGQEWYIAITKTKTSYKKVLNFRRKSPNLLNAAPLRGRLELQVWTFSAASAAPEKAAGNRLEAHPPSPSPPSWMGRPVRGEGVMWRQLYIHFGRFLYVWTFSFSNKIKNKIRWQAQIQIQIKIKTRGNSIVYILRNISE